MALTPIKDRQNTDPKQALAAFIAIVDAFNAAEKAGFTMDRDTKRGDLLRHEFEYAPYSIEWDSMAERWTLTAETDWAIPVCSFNQDTTECREIDLCEQCHEVADMLEDLH